ncbi:MAG: M20/M25/M40 family metallo-hydrolase, partial [Gemmatimonadaceae bacterium]|nr:M20/M25/M40 family metallo-hydrolase [Gemmatimonadaceae bacterium]
MIRSRSAVTFILVAGLSACTPFMGGNAGSRTTAAITAGELRTRLEIFSDDSMLGRGVGTIGNRKGTQYIADEFRKMGLEPAGDSGTYFQDIHPAPTARLDLTKTVPGGARNVVAILRGSDPALRNTFVAIGAHNDAIGIVTPRDPDSVRAVNLLVEKLKNQVERMPTAAERDSIRSVVAASRVRPAVTRIDSIVNGADDDGSGTVGLLEIAETFAKSGTRPRRSVLFVSHTGEEAGLLGSRWFTDHPTVERDSIVAQINIDMIGRGGAADIRGGGPDYLQLIGARRLSTELGTIIDRVNSERTRPFV